MNIKEPNKYGTLNIGDIRSIEQLIGAKLHIQYVNFLIACNGGHPDCEYCVFDFDKGNNSTVLSEFFGASKAPDYMNIYYNYNVFKNRIPSNMIPIANDLGGNLVCIGISKNNYGKIYFWNHENESDFPDDYSNVELLANCFDEFMNKLYENEEDYSMELQIILNNDISALIELLDSGYNLETIIEGEKTILEWSATSGRVEMVEILLQRGAKIRNALEITKDNAVFNNKLITVVEYLEDYLTKKQ